MVLTPPESLNHLSSFPKLAPITSRAQIRCAVCRCLRGACRSSARTPSMNPFAGLSLGCSRSGLFRSGGSALASACRTIRRCTPDSRAIPRIVPLFVLSSNLLE